MERAYLENQSNASNACDVNTRLVERVLHEATLAGVKEYCICPGGRNSPFVVKLDLIDSVEKYYWPEERSCGFFALGRSKLTKRPVAVITTSGTAAGELLSVAMEGYYSGIPLLFITADRPRRYRGSGAPQTAEQVGIFGLYTPYRQDLAENEVCNLQKWKKKMPCHLNICFEES